MAARQSDQSELRGERGIYTVRSLAQSESWEAEILGGEEEDLIVTDMRSSNNVLGYIEIHSIILCQCQSIGLQPVHVFMPKN